MLLGEIPNKNSGSGKDFSLPENLLGDDNKVLLQAVEQSSNSVIVTDDQGIIKYVNQRFVEVTGFSRDEVLGQHTRMLKSGKQNSEYYSKLWKTIRSGQTWSGEFINKKKNGELFWEHATISPVINSQGVITHFLAIKENITRTKRAEEALKRERKQLRQIIDLVPHMIYVRDKENKYLLINRAVASYFNLHPDKVLGKADVSLSFDKKAAELRWKEDRNVIARQKPMIRNDQVIRVSENETRVFQSAKLPFQLAGHDEDVVLGIMVDITRQKAHEEQLIKAREESLRTSREKDAYLSVMTHEIRTPLNSIIGMVRLLAANNQDEELAENLEVLRFSAENLMTLVNDILDFSKMNEGMVEFENQVFDLKEHLKKTCQSLLPRAREKRLKLVTSLDAKIPDQVKGDSLRLSQILNNLLGNAIKFTQTGGITLSAKVLDSNAGKLIISFSVKDTGIGIGPEKFETLFEPFRQAAKDTTRKYGGTGLGLSIAKGLVEAQGGNIKVESKPGSGSVFSFTLPFDHAATSDTETEAGAKKELLDPSASQLDVLMVEDNVMSIILAKKIFSKWNFNLSLAETGAVAIRKVLASRFDIILLDLQMTDMDGFEIMEVIKGNAESKNRQTPVIAFTASTDAAIRQKTAEAGMVDFVVKPYQPEDLKDRILGYAQKDDYQTGGRGRRKPGMQSRLDQCLEENRDGLPSLIEKLGMLQQILSHSPDTIFEKHWQVLHQVLIPALKNCGLQHEVDGWNDFLRLLSTFTGENKRFLLDTIKSDLKKQLAFLIERARYVYQAEA
jgi:PAS domain S-box-containing protein